MMNNLQVIEQNGQRVLTTQQLADKYETDPRTISNNFNRNIERYREGIDYFALGGEEKRAFIGFCQLDSRLKCAGQLYLWTEKGCLLHAKSLNTDKAWEVYGALLATYFKTKGISIAPAGAARHSKLTAEGAPWSMLANHNNASAIFGKKRLPTYFGVVYAVEYGEFIKIGVSTYPAQRFKALATVGRNYADKALGRALVSQPHTNYLENERYLHNLFSKKRIGNGELFGITLEEFAQTPKEIIFANDAASKKAKGDAAVGQLIEFLFGRDCSERIASFQ